MSAIRALFASGDAISEYPQVPQDFSIDQQMEIAGEAYIITDPPMAASGAMVLWRAEKGRGMFVEEGIWHWDVGLAENVRHMTMAFPGLLNVGLALKLGDRKAIGSGLTVVVVGQDSVKFEGPMPRGATLPGFSLAVVSKK